jgi:hypothetical protein
VAYPGRGFDGRLARAMVRALTSFAPASSSDLAASLNVLPVVNMSSISRIVAPVTRFGSGTPNARSTDLARSILSIPARCRLVCFVRVISFRSIGMRQDLARTRAINSAWLKPRSRSLDRWSGIGTMKSAARTGLSRRYVVSIIAASLEQICGFDFRKRMLASNPPLYAPHARAAASDRSLHHPQARGPEPVERGAGAPHFRQIVRVSKRSVIEGSVQHPAQTIPSSADSIEFAHNRQSPGYASPRMPSLISANPWANTHKSPGEWSALTRGRRQRDWSKGARGCRSRGGHILYSGRSCTQAGGPPLHELLRPLLRPASLAPGVPGNVCSSGPMVWPPTASPESRSRN